MEGGRNIGRRYGNALLHGTVGCPGARRPDRLARWTVSRQGV